MGPGGGSCATGDGERLHVLDPLAAPSEIDELAAAHAQGLAKRLGAALYVPPPDDGDPSRLRDRCS